MKGGPHPAGPVKSDGGEWTGPFTDTHCRRYIQYGRP
jgi:hypothetical protein